ncbi:MAG: hypothetical protein DWQ21_07400 [Bacteroidetes bacterium]|nr:MAG: hypothetical protein DWQ21_07400 [Bacteroidota bacterium]REK64277.1 MAG: hypothetical protein DWQ49_01665 [Bacteroidota bacterium]
MRLLYILIIITPISGCNTQEYTLMFSDKKDNTVFTLIKSVNKDEQCFTFSQEEQNSIRKCNLNQGELIIIVDFPKNRTGN